MVIIRRYTEERVAARPIPGFRAPTQVADTGQGLVSQASKIALQEKDKADRAAANEAVRAARAQRSMLMYGDPTAGVKGLAFMEGQELFKTAGEAPSIYRGYLDKLTNGLSNSRQQEYAKAALDPEYDSFVESLSEHEGKQLSQYYKGSYEAQQVSTSDTATLDASEAGADWQGVTLRALEQMRFETEKFATDNPELIGDVPINQWLETETKKRTSKHHAQTLDHMLKMPGGEERAQEYMAVFGAELLPGDGVAASKAVQVASSIGRQQDFFREIDKALPVVVGADEEAMAAEGVNYRPPEQQLIERKKEARKYGESVGMTPGEIEDLVSYVDQRTSEDIQEQEGAQNARYLQMHEKLLALGGDYSALEKGYSKELSSLSVKQKSALAEVATEADITDAYDKWVQFALDDPASFRQVPAAEIHMSLKDDPEKMKRILDWHGDANDPIQTFEGALSDFARELYGPENDKQTIAKRNALRADVERAAAASGGAKNLKPDQFRKLMESTAAQKTLMSVDLRSDVFLDTKVLVGDLNADDLDYETVDELPKEYKDAIRSVAVQAAKAANSSFFNLSVEERNRLELEIFVKMAQAGAIKP